MAECDCGNGASCCKVTGTENCSCNEKSFAESANLAFFKATDCDNLCFGKKLVLCPDGEVCAFITQEINSIGLKVKVVEKLFIFLGGWDKPKEKRKSEKIFSNVDEARHANLLKIENVSLKGVSFSSEVDGQIRKGLVSSPF